MTSKAFSSSREHSTDSLVGEKQCQRLGTKSKAGTNYVGLLVKSGRKFSW